MRLWRYSFTRKPISTCIYNLCLFGSRGEGLLGWYADVGRANVLYSTSIYSIRSTTETEPASLLSVLCVLLQLKAERFFLPIDHFTFEYRVVQYDGTLCAKQSRMFSLQKVPDWPGIESVNLSVVLLGTCAVIISAMCAILTTYSRSRSFQCNFGTNWWNS